MDENLRKKVNYSYYLYTVGKFFSQLIEEDFYHMHKNMLKTCKAFDVLFILHHHQDRLSVSKIANFGLMHISTAFNTSSALEKEGLVISTKHITDSRITEFEITDKGRRIIKEIYQRSADKLTNMEKIEQRSKKIIGYVPSFNDLKFVTHEMTTSDNQEFIDFIETLK